jgi:hypothetical protein
MTFGRVLIGGWIFFFVYVALAFALPKQVLPFGAPAIYLGILLGPLTFAYAVAHVVRNRLRNRKS